MSEQDFLYSIRAHKEGFDFSALSPTKQELSCKLYGGYDMIWDLYEARTVYYDIMHQNMMYELKEDWVFPKSGYYGGCILSCNKTKNRHRLEYVMDVIINKDEMKHIKFDTSLDNPIYKTIKKRFKLRPGTKINLNECIGKLIYLKIENIITRYDTPFSVLKDAMILNELHEETIWEMFDLILEQTEECEDEGG